MIKRQVTGENHKHIFEGKFETLPVEQFNYNQSIHNWNWA